MSLSRRDLLTSTGLALLLSWKLSDDQIAAVLTYIRDSWANAAAADAGKDAARMRRQLVEQP